MSVPGIETQNIPAFLLSIRTGMRATDRFQLNCAMCLSNPAGLAGLDKYRKQHDIFR
jgi:hypothetical protein